MGIGKNIRFHRDERLKITLERLSELSGVDVGTISALEIRDSQRSKFFPNIAKALGLSMDELSISPNDWVKLNLDFKNKNEVILKSDVISLPLMNVVGSMGIGNHEPDQEIVVDMLRVSKSWVDKSLGHISGIANLAFIHAIGDSMSPTFNDGDILLVDTGNKQATADKIYVLKAHGRLFIKRIRQRLDGSFEVSSDNPSVKTVDILNGDHEVIIMGRIVWIWNGKKI